MTVVAVDGQYVHPLTVDELRIATAETFDVIVEPTGQDAYTVFAQDSARTGYVRGTLAVREGLDAPVPPLDPRPLLSMADMGHGQHGTHGPTAATTTHAHGGHGASTGAHSPHGDDTHRMQSHPPSEAYNPLVDMQTMAPTARLADPAACATMDVASPPMPRWRACFPIRMGASPRARSNST